MATANANLASELIGNKEVATLIAAAITIKKSKAQAATIGKLQTPSTTSLDELKASATRLPDAKIPRTVQYQKSGGMIQANKDFDNLGLNNIKEIPDKPGCRIGTLPDGTKVIARDSSSGGYPTLEIQKANSKKKDKIRYVD